jgi:hypothetical protein
MGSPQTSGRRYDLVALETTCPTVTWSEGRCADVAQLVEHHSRKVGVPSSSLGVGSQISRLISAHLINSCRFLNALRRVFEEFGLSGATNAA